MITINHQNIDSNNNVEIYYGQDRQCDGDGNGNIAY